MEIKTERADSESAPSTIRATEIPRSGLVQDAICGRKIYVAPRAQPRLE
jgi:hypothetical protein